jgi:hypothetical protein
LEVRAVEVTGSHIGDAPVLPDLLSQIPDDQQMAVSRQTVPTTPASATMPSQIAVPMPSSRPAGTPSRGR